MQLLSFVLFALETLQDLSALGKRHFLFLEMIPRKKVLPILVCLTFINTCQLWQRPRLTCQLAKWVINRDVEMVDYVHRRQQIDQCAWALGSFC